MYYFVTHPQIRNVGLLIISRLAFFTLYAQPAPGGHLALLSSPEIP
ncbi:hypothetical protein HMPREF0201_00538 [Cedecea davisae DSM 4568]|uniref:Uncharacterized protein n=1 Tax=Cedecea davisae DSM 4568 TaxID=566551 RepID=S3J4J1_9ENTR|nr:hypothetical protein HMPREF0201_00538 [Cedecea davisae DSM 4568]